MENPCWCSDPKAKVGKTEPSTLARGQLFLHVSVLTFLLHWWETTHRSRTVSCVFPCVNYPYDRSVGRTKLYVFNKQFEIKHNVFLKLPLGFLAWGSDSSKDRFSWSVKKVKILTFCTPLFVVTVAGFYISTVNWDKMQREWLEPKQQYAKLCELITKRRPFPEYLSLWVSSAARIGGINQQVKSCVITAIIGRFLGIVYYMAVHRGGWTSKGLEDSILIIPSIGMAECLSEAKPPKPVGRLPGRAFCLSFNSYPWLWQDAFWEGFVEHGWSKTSLMWVFVVWLGVKDHKIKSFSCTARLDQVTGLKGQDRKRAAAECGNLREGKGFLCPSSLLLAVARMWIVLG